MCRERIRSAPSPCNRRFPASAPRQPRQSACPADIPDDPEYFRDAPISLQVIGKKYEEEAVIR